MATAMGDTQFSNFYREVMAHPSVANRAWEMTKEFRALDSDAARFRYMQKMEPVKEYDHEIFTGDKSQSKSDTARKLGNESFQQKNFHRALQYYNECIKYAKPGESLALGFANRSALLYDRGRQAEALADIERSFEAGYPAGLAYKLHLRKAKILSDQEKFTEAEEEIGKGRKCLPTDEKLSAAWDAKFDEVVAFLKTRDERAGGDLSQAMNCLKIVETPDWKVYGTVNAAFPSASSYVDMESSEDVGRKFVAKRDLAPGDVIMVEKPYVSCLLPDAHGDHCHNCYKWCDVPVPCLSCSSTVFCSEECKSSASRFHDVECAAMETIYDDEYGTSAYLAFRTILTKTPAEWKEFAASSLASAPGENDCLTANVNSVYHSTDYVNVYTLIKNSAARSPSDLFKRTLMAFLLVETLKKTYLKDEKDLEDDFVVFLGSIVLRHVQNYPCNAHSVNEMVVNDPKNMAKCTDDEIAAAVYPTLSLLNHSCDPNITRVQVGDLAVVRVTRPIKSGEDILCNYGALYATMRVQERQVALQKQYFFRCRCVPCEQNWPVFAELNSRGERYRCPKCANPMLAKPTLVCQNCVENLAMLWETVDVMMSNYAVVYDKVLIGISDAACVKFLVDYLTFLDEVVVRPSAAYNDCQETLKQCFFSEGNKRVPWES